WCSCCPESRLPNCSKPFGEVPSRDSTSSKECWLTGAPRPPSVGPNSLGPMIRPRRTIAAHEVRPFALGHLSRAPRMPLCEQAKHISEGGQHLGHGGDHLIDATLDPPAQAICRPRVWRCRLPPVSTLRQRNPLLAGHGPQLAVLCFLEADHPGAA